RQRERSVIYQNVDPSEAFEGASRDLVRDAVRRDVARHGEGTLADFFRQRLGALAVADIHRDRGAALVQARCGSSSKAAPRTCDDRDAPRKIGVFHQKNCFTLPEFFYSWNELLRLTIKLSDRRPTTLVRAQNDERISNNIGAQKGGGGSLQRAG